MTRYLVIRTKSSLLFLKISKNARPLTTWKQRIFRTDERFMVADRTGTDEFVMYDIDGTQPYGAGVKLNPDETMALIDVARANKNKAVTKLDALNAMDSKIFLYGIIGIVILYALLSGGIA